MEGLLINFFHGEIQQSKYSQFKLKACKVHFAYQRYKKLLYIIYSYICWLLVTQYYCVQVPTQKTTHHQWLNAGILKHEETGTVNADEINKVSHFKVVTAFDCHKSGNW